MPLNYMETGSLLLSKVSVNRLYFFARLFRGMRLRRRNRTARDGGGAEGERWKAIGIPAGIEDPKGWRGDSGLVGKGGWKRGILVQYLLLILRGF